MDFSHIEPVSNEPFEFGPIQTKWLEALESGNYKQGQGYLKNKDGYCCLGVLCEVMELEHSEVESGATYFKCGQGESAAYVPQAAVPSTGLRSTAGGFFKHVRLANGNFYSGLTSMNDDLGNGGMSFADIAAYIRHDPHNVFKAAA